MEQLNVVQIREELKWAFLSSKYSTVEMFAKYSGVWDKAISVYSCIEWNYEKKSFLDAQLTKDEAAREMYVANLNERVAMTAQLTDILQSKIEELRNESDLDVKEISNIIASIQKLSDIQDKSMQILKIDGARSDKFNTNKRTVVDVLLGRGNTGKRPTRV